MQLIVNKNTKLVERVFTDAVEVFLTTGNLRVGKTKYPGFSIFTHRLVVLPEQDLPVQPMPINTYLYVNGVFEHSRPDNPEWTFALRKLKEKDASHRKTQ